MASSVRWASLRWKTRLEDKIVQQAARTVLECIYEQDFLGFSLGLSVVPDGLTGLRQFRDALQAKWFRALRRPSRRGRHLIWEKLPKEEFSKLSKRWLPTSKILHPYPNVRFASQHPR